MFSSNARCLRLVVVLGGLFLAPAIWAAHVNPRTLNGSKPKSSRKLSESQRTRRRMRHLASGRSTTGHVASRRTANHA